MHPTCLGRLQRTLATAEQGTARERAKTPASHAGIPHPPRARSLRSACRPAGQCVPCRAPRTRRRGCRTAVLVDLPGAPQLLLRHTMQAHTGGVLRLVCLISEAPGHQGRS